VPELLGIKAHLLSRYTEFLGYLLIGKTTLEQGTNHVKPFLTTRGPVSSHNCDGGIEFSLAAPAAELSVPSSKLRARYLKFLSAEVALDKKSCWLVRLKHSFQHLPYPLSRETESVAYLGVGHAFAS
jgi:hypothetical protein